jgi:hypothetical protein
LTVFTQTVGPELPNFLLQIIIRSHRAVWLKWAEDEFAEPRMVVLSITYANKYGRKFLGYPGQTDRVMWPEAWRVFLAMDRHAILNEETLISGLEPTPGGPTDFCLSHKIAVPERHGLFRHRTGFWIYGEADDYHGNSDGSELGGERDGVHMGFVAGVQEAPQHGAARKLHQHAGRGSRAIGRILRAAAGGP